MITDMYGGLNRRRRALLQTGADAFASYLDLESAEALAAAAGAAAGAEQARTKLPVRTAKLLISKTEAAAIECATVAYPAIGAAINTTVGVKLASASAMPPAGPGDKAAKGANATAAANALGGSRLSLTFPYFETLVYDPVVTFGPTDGMALADAAGAGGACHGAACGRAADRRASGAVAARGGAAALAAAAIAAALLL